MGFPPTPSPTKPEQLHFKKLFLRQSVQSVLACDDRQDCDLSRNLGMHLLDVLHFVWPADWVRFVKMTGPPGLKSWGRGATAKCFRKKNILGVTLSSFVTILHCGKASVFGAANSSAIRNVHVSPLHPHPPSAFSLWPHATTDRAQGANSSFQPPPPRSNFAPHSANAHAARFFADQFRPEKHNELKWTRFLSAFSKGCSVACRRCANFCVKIWARYSAASRSACSAA